MATLTAGNSIVVTIEAGNTLYIRGSAEVTINPGQTQLINGDGRIGTFTTNVNATIKAITDCVYADVEAISPVQAVSTNNGNSIQSFISPGGNELSVNKNTYSMKIALGIIGAQSNEGGRSQVVDSLGVAQLGSLSAPSQGIYEPVQLCKSGYGSMFTHAAELLGRDGIRVELFNGSVGSSSGIYDWCGVIQMTGRANSTAYRGKRNTEGDGDPGHRGDLIYVNGATWEATTGNRHLVFTNVPIVIAGVTYYSDPGTVTKETTLTTAASPPVFPGSPTVGNTVTDGGIVWTCIHVGARTADGGTSVRVIRNSDDGFDPYFMLTRVRTAMMNAAVPERKRFVYFQNGQTDAGQPTALYTLALRMMSLFMCSSPYKLIPIYGLSIYFIGSSTSSYDTIETSLSGGGIATEPNYATSALTTGMVSNGFNLGTPGTAMTDFRFYYGTSLYRYFGTDVAKLGLSSGQPHTDVNGAIMCAEALYPTLRKIVTNSAT